MIIKNLKNKVNIILEYSKKNLGFGIISKNDLDKLLIRIFLMNGQELDISQIKEISFKVREEKVTK